MKRAPRLYSLEVKLTARQYRKLRSFVYYEWVPACATPRNMAQAASELLGDYLEDLPVGPEDDPQFPPETEAALAHMTECMSAYYDQYEAGG